MKRFSFLLVVLATLLFSTAAFATDDGAFAIKIITNVTATSDTAVHLSNSGSYWGVTGTGDPALGYICANVYVFSADEQLQSCCSCPLSPNSIHGFSAANDLVTNNLTGRPLSNIVVKVVATAPIVVGTSRLCNASYTLPVEGGLVAEAKVAGGVDIDFLSATLSATELTRARTLCGFNQMNGSGPGVCAINNPLCTAPAGF